MNHKGSKIEAVLLLIILLAGCDMAPAQTIAPAPTQSPIVSTSRPAPTRVATSPPARSATSRPTPSATAAPTLAPTPTPDPSAEFAPAMRAGPAGNLDRLAKLPRYDLQMWVDTQQAVVTGTEQIVFPNQTGAALDEIALRLYPNFPADVFGKGGDTRMEMTGAAVAGQPAALRYAAQRTAALIALPASLAPGAATTLELTFTATIKPWRDETWPLPSYYPMLAVHDKAGWRLDVTRFADRVYAESAFYAAEITTPANLSVVASGSTIGSDTGADGWATHHIRTGPVREFAITVGDFAAAHAVGGAAGDVAVNVYSARGSRMDAQQVARVAAAALSDFDKRFGAYPYHELDLQLLPYQFDGGDEYPGLILLYSDGPIDAGARYVTAHEVAHQWWYGVIGNDIYRAPWLDEALAQYSGIVYAEDVAGAATAQADWQREVLRRYRGALQDGDRPVGLGIAGYPSFNVYYRTVYGKGPVFLRALRDEIGDQAFFGGLASYYQAHRFGIATTRDLQQAFEAASGRDLGALFQQWVK